MTYIVAVSYVKGEYTGCVGVCPVDRIHPAKDERSFLEASQSRVDGGECMGRGTCETACPVSAAFPEDKKFRRKWKSFIPSQLRVTEGVRNLSR